MRLKVLSILVVGVPLIWLLLLLANSWFDFELFIDIPFIGLLFNPLTYMMLLTGCMSIVIGLIIACMKPWISETSHVDNPADSKELDEIKADIKELQEATADMRAMTKLRNKKAKREN